MKNVPYWQGLMLLYFVMVALPVLLVHYRLKARILRNKTALNLVIYTLAVTGTAFLMHFITMWAYFKFIFPGRSSASPVF